MFILSITTMFPHKNEPSFGVFVQRRLEALSKIVDITIVSPQPYFPLLTLFKRYHVRKGIPYERDLNDRTKVYYPRFFSFPVIFKPLDGFFLFVSLYFFIKKMKRKGIQFDLLDAHLAYPEGFAAVLLGKIFKLPVTITLRGHDINYLPKFPVRKRQVLYALKHADKGFSVANALRLKAGDIGINIDKIVVASNGVQTDIFYPLDRVKVRKKLNFPLNKKIILSVGYLIERKGFDLLIDALHILHSQEKMTDVSLVILGGIGYEPYVKPQLEAQIDTYNLHDSVFFVEPKKNEELCEWYNLADVFALASSLEGWPNVILEAIACGTPVVGANVWGIPEIYGDDTDIGLLADRNPTAIAAQLKIALTKEWDQKYLRRFAEARTWEKTADLLKSEMKKLIRRP